MNFSAKEERYRSLTKSVAIWVCISSTIKEADVILVMDQGSIVEKGNHESYWVKMERMPNFTTASLPMKSKLENKQHF